MNPSFVDHPDHLKDDQRSFIHFFLFSVSFGQIQTKKQNVTFKYWSLKNKSIFFFYSSIHPMLVVVMMLMMLMMMTLTKFVVPNDLEEGERKFTNFFLFIFVASFVWWNWPVSVLRFFFVNSFPILTIIKYLNFKLFHVKNRMKENKRHKN